MTTIDNSLLNAALFPHQINGVKWMINCERTYCAGLLADDMGLGKSYQCLSLMAHQQPSPSDDRRTTLIVLPLSLIQQWKNEITSKINLPWKVAVYHGDSRKSTEFSAYDVIITTYQCLAKDHPKIPKGCRRVVRFTPYARRSNIPDLSDEYGPLLKHKWYRVVLDESQNIKNGACLTAVAARALDATYRWCLSGTPIQNSYDEVHSITSFLFKQIDTRHTDVDDLLHKVTLRRLKENVMKDLPTKTIKDIQLTMTEEEKYIYNTFEEKAQDEISEIISKGNLRDGGMASILTLLLRWRQICDHPNLFLNTTLKYSSKQQKVLRLLRQIMESKPGEKVVIFSHFVEMISMYEAPLKLLGWNYVTFIGSMNSKQREAALSTFKEDANVRIILMSTKAGNVGLNLVNANHVILTEPWWNPFVDDQAVDRVHRIGQEKAVRIYKLVIKGTIEERILDIQAHKRNMFAQVFGGEVTKGGQAGLSMSDIMYLANM